MKKPLLKRTLTLLALLLCLMLSVPAQAAQTAVTPIGRQDHQPVEMSRSGFASAPSVDADAAILVELNSGVILYSKDMNRQMFPASLTKILTALIVLESDELSMNDTLTVSNAAVTDLVWGGADGKGRFYQGQTLSVEDALYALCLDSVNTIGYAFAERLAGDLEGFAVLQNARAKELGAKNTNFRNPHGLNDDLHLTTAYDLALMLWEASENDAYRTIAGTPTYSFQDGKEQIIDCVANLAVLREDSPYYDSRVVCGKTGYTSDAMYTRAAYATDGKLDLIAVTLHSDSTALSWSDLRSLFDYGFDNFYLTDAPQPTTTELDAEWQLSAGEMQPVTYRLAATEVVTGASLLLPNSVKEQPWTSSVEFESDGSFRLVYRKGGTEYAYAPLSVVLEKEEPAETTPAATMAAPTEPEPAVPAQSSPNRVLVIVLAVLLLAVIAELLIILRLRQDRELLERRLRRRMEQKNG